MLNILMCNFRLLDIINIKNNYNKTPEPQDTTGHFEVADPSMSTKW